MPRTASQDVGSGIAHDGPGSYSVAPWRRQGATAPKKRDKVRTRSDYLNDMLGKFCVCLANCECFHTIDILVVVEGSHSKRNDDYSQKKTKTKE